MEIALMMQFWVVCMLLVMSPGADWAFAIGAGVKAKSVWPSIAGILVGYVIVVAVISAGVGSLAVQYPQLITALTIIGSLYLLYLGASALRSTPDASALAVAEMDADARRQFVKGIGVSALNPKGLLLLLALLPQFVSSTGWATGAQMFALGSIHIVNCAIVYTAVAMIARRALRGRPTASAWVARGSGVVLLLVGSVLLIEQLVALS
ncbi:LysE family translocator [Gulosibacter bifidus]|uniref:LysE family translocator n=1 Tax=Gulosibacter bifidus TaxID=272239 RepID=A0ABW5RI69_9MICO|nr:LysE family translocator [Gulosibacter bifidus]